MSALRIDPRLPLVIILALTARLANAEAPPYSAVQAILNERCVDCHAAGDAENDLVLESFADFAKGGKSGAAFVAKESEKSRLVPMIEGREGVKIMPPGKRKKLTKEEIALIRAWIDGGAPGPNPDEVALAKPAIPAIKPTVPPTNPILSLAYSASAQRLALGRYKAVELAPPRDVAEAKASFASRLEGAVGNVNKVLFSADGLTVFGASGEPGRSGQILQWNARDGKLIRSIRGHSDMVYSLALSPDGQWLATGSYDQKIKLWNVATGEEARTLRGHNGAVFGLAFRPDGKVLASASGDTTIKLWEVQSGKRLDTLSQPLKEQYAVAFHPNGRWLYAGGVDNRIRKWSISADAKEGTNEILESRFAHEGAILALAFSPDGKSLASTADDGTAKIWDAEALKEKLLLEKQPDWPVAAAFLAEGKSLAVGRLDGAFQQYQSADGKVVLPPKPELARAHPRGAQIGQSTQVTLYGKSLGGVTEFKASQPGVSAIIESKQMDSLRILVTSKTDVAPGKVTLSAIAPGGESNGVLLELDHLPQLAVGSEPISLPASVWGQFTSAGQVDEIRFQAKKGQELVLDCAAESLGAKSAPMVMVLGKSGARLAGARAQENSRDPLLAFAVPEDGEYSVRVSDAMLGATGEHFYRLSLGEFAFVTAAHPASVPVNQETMVALLGHNLKGKSCEFVKPTKPGPIAVPLDPKTHRSRGPVKVLASAAPQSLEQEPNNDAKTARSLAVGVVVSGQFDGPSSDDDFFRFSAKAGQRLIVETRARAHGSPADTKLEVLWPDGQPIERVVLQAVRDSAVTFRPEDSMDPGMRLDNWEEMTLNQYLYLQGEVVKTFRMPQGPDSDMTFYSVGSHRRTYFGTSSSAHALNEVCYIVEPHPPGTKLVSNGLPVFPIHFKNDDDDERKLGADSRLVFTAPKDGEYLVHVQDSRGFGGPNFTYWLTVRDAKPDFSASVDLRDPGVPPGTGRTFSVSVDRRDDFDGEINVDVTGLPKGFQVSTPIVVQEGQLSAQGTLFAAVDATPPSDAEASASKIVAWAVIDGQRVEHEAGNLGKIALGPSPTLRVSLTASRQAATGQEVITIRPGTTISAWLHIERQGHDDLVTFAVNNLPHGVIVDNIGLNGVLIPKGEAEREIFLTAYDWVPETERLCHAIANQAGNPTSSPVLLRVAKAKVEQAEARP